jgi:transposase InsO family protein
MFIEQSILELDFGIPTESIKTSTKRYRQGKSHSWANQKDPKDRRKVLIDIDSIPEATRKKYNIPTGKEYFEQKQQEAYKAEQERIQRANEMRANAEKSALYNAYHNDYFQFLELYEKRYSYSMEYKELANLSAREHAFWLKMIEVTGSKFKTFDGGCKRGHSLYLDLKKELIFSINIETESYFRLTLSRLRKLLIQGKCISEEVANKKRKPKPYHKKTNDFHKGFAMAILGHPNKYTYRIATEIINHHAPLENQSLITESWIKWLMTNDNHFRTVVKASRNGSKWTSDNLIQHAVRKSTPFPGNVWMIDGTPLQFYCWNESRTQIIKLYLFVVMDVCSRKIVGHSISYSENRFSIMDALKMAVTNEGHLPAEIVSDNFSASKTEEIKYLAEQMAKLGVNWRYARVGNPQDKSYVERFFGVFQSMECALHDDYIGEGIMSTRDNRRIAEELLKTAKRDGLPSVSKMKDKILQLLIKYNGRVKKDGKAPNEVYKTLPKPNAVELDTLKTALLFWTRTKATVHKDIVEITVNKEKHSFEVKDHKISTELQGKQVYVRYDKHDLEQIILFDLRNETVICECKKCLVVPLFDGDKTEADADNVLKISAKQKSKRKYLADQKNNTIQAGLEKIGKESIDIIHPLGLEKNKLIKAEELAELERLRKIHGVDANDQQEERTKPLMRIEKETPMSYEEAVTKKPQRGFKKTTFKNVENDNQ